MQQGHEQYRERDRGYRGNAQRRHGGRFDQEHPRDERGRFVDEDDESARFGGRQSRADDEEREPRSYDEERGGHRGWEEESRDERGRFTGYEGRSSFGGARRGPHSGKGPKGYQRSEQRILDDANEALAEHPDLDASEIEVDVESGGVVVLRGTVESRRSKRMAEDCMEEVAGVQDVRNELRLQSAENGSGNRHESQ